MDKLNFMNELMGVSDDGSAVYANYEAAIAYNNQINLFFRAIQYISDVYNARDEIMITPKDFRGGSVNNEFYFTFSNKIITTIPDGETHECELGKFVITNSESSAGYKCVVDVNEKLFSTGEDRDVVNQLYSDKWIK